MTTTISKLYPTYDRAQAAVQELQTAGVPHSDISIVSNNSDSWFSKDGSTTDTTKRVDGDGDGVDDRAEGAGAGASIGAGVGGAAGLLDGLGLLAIPGVGPVERDPGHAVGGNRRDDGPRSRGPEHGRACGLDLSLYRRRTHHERANGVPVHGRGAYGLRRHP